jgi:hypothetical protein
MAIEPLHPMYAAERSCITSLEEANVLAEKFDPGVVGIVVDVYHWLVPTPDMLMGRGMMGDGCIDIHRIRRLVEADGYMGCIEVEILNQAIWDQPGDEVLQRMKERCLSCVLNPPSPKAPSRERES